MLEEDFVSVTKEKFFATVGAMDVHPDPHRDVTHWRTKNGTIYGVTTPGYMCVGEKIYKIRRTLLRG